MRVHARGKVGCVRAQIDTETRNEDGLTRRRFYIDRRRINREPWTRYHAGHA